MIELWHGRRIPTGTRFTRHPEDFPTVREAFRAVAHLGAGEFQLADASGEIATLTQGLDRPPTLHPGPGQDPGEILLFCALEGLEPELNLDPEEMACCSST